MLLSLAKKREREREREREKENSTFRNSRHQNKTENNNAY